MLRVRGQLVQRHAGRLLELRDEPLGVGPGNTGGHAVGNFQHRLPCVVHRDEAAPLVRAQDLHRSGEMKRCHRSVLAIDLLTRPLRCGGLCAGAKPPGRWSPACALGYRGRRASLDAFAVNTPLQPPQHPSGSPWRVCVAPMMAWTDRHCRFFHRLLTRRARLYTEMVTTGALLHGDVPRHLEFDPFEQPVALQLGGSEPEDLAASARLGERWGYAEINLNCGCPSERVQRGAFGACLMAEPELVAECVRAMRDAVAIPVTVKHRIGIDRQESYSFVRDFVGTVAQGGCEVFIVHARNAWLHGVSPKENRELPPLRHDVVTALKKDFPGLVFVLNGGVCGNDAIAAHLDGADGVMVGRAAYHQPWDLVAWDARFFDSAHTLPTRDEVEAAMVGYMERLVACGEPWSHASRHMLGLRNGEPGARRWRQVWSAPHLKVEAPATVSRLARQALAGTLNPAAAPATSPAPPRPARARTPRLATR